MGRFVDFHCRHCRLEMTEIPVGQGRQPYPSLALFRCRQCKTVGSTWIQPDRPVVCGTCYAQGVELLPEETTRLDCPKCGGRARITPREGHWE